jgi:hypothetical protein
LRCVAAVFETKLAHRFIFFISFRPGFNAKSQGNISMVKQSAQPTKFDLAIAHLRNKTVINLKKIQSRPIVTESAKRSI